MTTAREAAVNVAVLKALADQVKTAQDLAKGDVMAALDPGDRKAAVLPDGTDVGTVSVTKEGQTVKVVDERAFLTWVKHAAPTEVEERVRDAYKKRVIDSAKITSAGVVDPGSGEVIPGLAVRPKSSYVSVRQSAEQKAAVAQAWRDGRLAELLADAIVLEIE